MKKIIILIVLTFSISFTSCKKSGKTTEKEATEVVVKTDLTVVKQYKCPMECENEKTYEKEGDCPVCKMKLREHKKKHKHEEH